MVAWMIKRTVGRGGGGGQEKCISRWPSPQPSSLCLYSLRSRFLCLSVETYENPEQCTNRYSPKIVLLPKLTGVLSVISIQRWLNSLHEHCAYSTFYTTQPTLLIDDQEQDVIPLGSMQDSLKVNCIKKKIYVHHVYPLIS